VQRARQVRARRVRLDPLDRVVAPAGRRARVGRPVRLGLRELGQRVRLGAAAQAEPLEPLALRAARDPPGLPARVGRKAPQAPQALRAQWAPRVPQVPLGLKVPRDL
jgi:hypothetical protein